jgi:uncharacterized protein (TIGR03067 family)
MTPLSSIATIPISVLLLLSGQGNVGETAEAGEARCFQGIQGVWHAVSMEGAGVTGAKRLSVEVTEKMLVIRLENKVVIEAKYMLDPKRTPPTIDLEFQGQRTPGIYDLKDNTLRLCFGPEKARPTAFAGTQDTMLLILSRQGGQFVKQAVASFNQEAAEDPIGRREPPLTEDELIAAIRGWDRRGSPVDDATYRIYQRIADSGVLAPDARLEFTTGWVARGYTFTVWWIDLSVKTGETTGYTYRIRDRKIHCRSHVDGSEAGGN